MSLEKIASADSYITSLNSIFNFSLNPSQKSKKNSKESSSLINDEYCYNCNEGGNLINCDRCPASFHLLCHNPPLDIDQIPKGEFLCNKCKNNSMIGVNHADTKKTTIHFEKYESDSALDTLCRMAKSLNPKEMALSDEMNLHCEFSIPGLSRIKWFANEYKLKAASYQSKSSNSRQMCQICSKFEWSKKMIKCDYCESIYHQDCLFMHIDQIPTKDKIWMCPMHCEHLLNTKFLKSQKLSDRIKLWNDFELHFKKQKKIEKEFINKCNDKSNKNAFCRPIPASNIPTTVKNLYEQKSQPDHFEPLCFGEDFCAAKSLALLSNKTKEIRIKIASLSREDLVKPKALLKYVSDEYDLFEYPIPLTKSCTSIGKSAKNDVCLANEFVQCKHLSDRHATIFHDFGTNRYEILNYSEHGVGVDCVKLGFELGELDEEGGQDHLAAYEGSVELKHGSLIQIGCFRFLFVVIDYDLSFDANQEDVTSRKWDQVKKKAFKTNNQSKKLSKANLIDKLEQVRQLSERSSSSLDQEINVLQKLINNSNKKNLII
ncbi:PHD finger 12 [Brachionus plicatilis]|uniref:PHD finger 12 n=1 Tax=Brachionus plicatilis TaxID=10195 RepID=A0A3M7RHP7_BRAPC|nr:PHD finger 12 [Brachionus plicatilis]